MTDLTTFEPVRLVVLALFTIAFWLYAWNIGRMWRARRWAANLLATGLLGVLGHVSLGQIKAAAYGLPADWITYVGGIAAAVVILALVLLQLGGVKHGEA